MRRIANTSMAGGPTLGRVPGDAAALPRVAGSVNGRRLEAWEFAVDARTVAGVTHYRIDVIFNARGGTRHFGRGRLWRT